MVFYFSGTGNSKWVAEEIAKGISDRTVDIAQYIKDGNDNYNVEKNEKIGFVFPVYSWTVPKIVLDFVKKVMVTSDTFTFGVITCGENIGDAMKQLKSLIPLSSEYSIVMPNNYILLGMDVDSDEIVELKIKTAKITIKAMVKEINENRKVSEIEKGSLAFLKTKLVGYFFNKYALDARPFFAESSCNSCGLCEKTCPTSNIILEDGKPRWGDKCIQCLACINRCPQVAIQYGKKTKNRGRYYFKAFKEN